MPELTVNSVIAKICNEIKSLATDDGEKPFKAVYGFVKPFKDVPIGDYPLAMLGFDGYRFPINNGEEGGMSKPPEGMTESCELLLVVAVRGSSGRAAMQTIKSAVVSLFKKRFNQQDFAIPECVLGDLHFGYTEPSETGILPTGAYIASWLGFGEPLSGFYVKFTLLFAAKEIK